MCAKKRGRTVAKGNAAVQGDPSSAAQGRWAGVLTAVSWPHVVGFGLCQTWSILCVALRDPITYGEPFLDLRWLSLATALVLSVAMAAAHGRMGWLVRGRAPLVAVSGIAAVCSLMGPMSALFAPPVSTALIHVAAVGVGAGFSVLFAIWYALFCSLRDMVGLACSVVASVLFTYPLANVLATDQMSPWIAAAIGSALPLASAACALLGAPGGGRSLLAAGTGAGEGRGFAGLGRVRGGLCLRTGVGLLAVTAAVEVMRNFLLGGTALAFYAGVANLGSAALKVACAVWLVAVFARRDAHGVAHGYRCAFLLLLGVVLCMPFLLQGNLFAHMLLDVGSFFFQLLMLMVAWRIAVGFGLGPFAVFGSLRAIWALGCLVGIAAGDAAWWASGAATMPALTAVLGIVVALAFVAVFTERECVWVLASMPVAERAPRFRTQCGLLARRHGVSDRELEVMLLTAKGRSAVRIADDLGVSVATVNSHVHHVYQKLAVHSRQELMDLIEAEPLDAPNEGGA